MTEKNKQLILIGGGGHCRSCIDVIELENRYSIVGILDKKENIGDTILGYKILGDDSDIYKYAESGCFFLITVGQIKNALLRKKLFERVVKTKGTLAKIVSPRAYVAKSSFIGEGTIVMHDVLINANTCIGNNCIINSKALIEHDCNIMSHCHVSTAAVINGDVEMGEGCFFGSNAVSKQGVSIEDGSFVKANSCFVSHDRKRTAFLTTIFPTNLQFVTDFFMSLSEQSYKKFDVIVLNDGYTDFHLIKERFKNLNIIELAAAGSIAKNRQALLQYSKVNDYDFAIFGDIDDTFSNERIEKSLEGLTRSDIVFNDLTSIKNGVVIDQCIYSHRLKDQELISLDFIKNKNVFGMSNTAVNLKVIPLSLTFFPDELVAVDWFFFTLLLLNGLKAHFIADAITYYRQHDSNTIGISSFSEEKINSILSVKIIHYKNLIAFSDQFNCLLDETLALKENILDKLLLNDLLIDNRNRVKYPLWWELTDFRNET